MICILWFDVFHLPLKNQKFSQQQVANDRDSVIKCYYSNLSVIRFLKETGG